MLSEPKAVQLKNGTNCNIVQNGERNIATCIIFCITRHNDAIMYGPHLQNISQQKYPCTIYIVGSAEIVLDSM